jgi:hypothetical protein
MSASFRIALFATVAATPQASLDETAVRNIIQEKIKAWNSGDAAAYSRHFAAEGTCAGRPNTVAAICLGLFSAPSRCVFSSASVTNAPHFVIG